MANCVIGRNATRDLYLRHNHANMGHGDDMAVWLLGINTVDKLFNAPCCVIPAFAIWRGNIARGFPISAGKIRIFLADFIKLQSIPITEIKFTDQWLIWQALSVLRDYIGGGGCAD